MNKRLVKVISMVLTVALVLGMFPVSTVFAQGTQSLQGISLNEEVPSPAESEAPSTPAETEVPSPTDSPEPSDTEEPTPTPTDTLTPLEPSEELVVADANIDVAATEVEEERTEYSKTFKLENGRYETVVYGMPIHYLDNGVYKDIDNTLLYTTDANGNKVYKNKQNSAEAEIASNASSLSNGDYKLTWTIDGVDASQKGDSEALSVTEDQLDQMREGDQRHNVANFASEVQYDGALQGMDVQKVVYSNRIKENIILDHYTGIKQIVQRVQAQGVDLVLNDDNSIKGVSKSTNETVFFMPAPYMYDSSEDNCIDIKVKLEKKSNTYIITYILDEEWLKSAVYPVIIDPTVQADDGTDNVLDNRINEDNPTTHYNSSYCMCTGYGSSSHLNYSLVKFINLPIDGNCTIESATFTAKMTYDASSSSVVGVHQVTEDWGLNVTWNTRPECNPTATSSQTVAATQNASYTWNITSIAQYWQSGHNFGLELRDTSTTSKYKEWATWNATYGPGPQLNITYYDSKAPNNVSGISKKSETANPNAGDNVSVTIGWGATTDPGYPRDATHPNWTGTGVSQYSITCNGQTKTVNAGQTLSATFTGLSDNASYTCVIKAKDNRDASRNWNSGTSFSFTTGDYTGPQINSINITDINNSTITDWTYITSVNLNWDLKDEGNGMNSGGILYYGIYQNGNPVQGYQYSVATSAYSGTRPMNLSSLPDGQYEIRVYAQDSGSFHDGKNRNTGAYASVAYKKDTKIDSSSITLQNGDFEGSNKVTKSTVTVVSSADDQLPIDWRLDIKPGADPVFNDSDTPLDGGTGIDVLSNNYALDLSGYENGNYTLRLKVTDAAGNYIYTKLTFQKVNVFLPATLQIDTPTGDTIDQTILNPEHGLDITYSRIDDEPTDGLNAGLYVNNELAGQSEAGNGFDFDITQTEEGQPRYPEDSNISLYVRANDGTTDYFSSDTDIYMPFCDEFNDSTGVDSENSPGIRVTSDGKVILATDANGYVSEGTLLSYLPTEDIQGGFAYIELQANEATLKDATGQYITRIRYYISGDGGNTWPIELTPGVKVYAPAIKSNLRLKAVLTSSDPTKTPELYDWQLNVRLIYYKDAIEYNYEFSELENGLRGLDEVIKVTDDGAHYIALKGYYADYGTLYASEGTFRTATKMLAADATQVYLTTSATHESNIVYSVSTDGGISWEDITPGIKTVLDNSGNELCMKVTMFSGPDFSLQPKIDSMSLQVYQNILGDKIMHVNLIDPPHNLSAYPQINYKTLLRWDASETAGVTYNVYRSKTRYFEPWDVEPIATGITETSWSDFNLDYGETYYYLVTAVKTFGENVRESTPTSDAYAKIVDQGELDKQLGLENYWTYTSFRTGGGSGYVNVSNGAEYFENEVKYKAGNVVYSATDLVVTGPVFAMTMRRTYNSMSSSRSALGDGWDYSFNTCLLIEYDDNGENEIGLLLKDGDGSIHRFRNTEAQPNKYLPDEKIYMTIDKIAIQENGQTYYEYRLTRKDNIVYYFDRELRLKYFSEPNGNRLTLHYDSRGNVDQVTNSVGQSMYLIYDATDRLIAVTDGIPVYDANHVLTDIQGGRTYIYEQPDDPRDVQLVSASYNEGSWAVKNLTHHESYDYHSNFTIVDPKNHTTVIEYSEGKIDKITLPNSECFDYSFTPDDATTEDCFDAKSIITDTLEGYSSIISYTANQQGQVTQFTDADNRTINYEYKWSSDSYQPSAMYYQNITGEDLELKDIRNSFEYDLKGNITLVKKESKLTTQGVGEYVLLAETKFEEYNSFNQPRYIKVRNSKDSTTYDVTEYEYYSYGNVLTVFDPLRRKTSNTYYHTNLYGETGSMTSYRIGLLETTIDYYGKKTEYTYDELGRLAQTNIYDKTNTLVSSARVDEYDDSNQPELVIDEMGNKTVYEYNPFGLPGSITQKNAAGTVLHTESYLYDQNFNLKYTESGLGTKLQKTQYDYDSMDRVQITQQLVDLVGGTEVWNTQTVSYHRNSDGDYVTTTVVYPDPSDNQVSISYYDKAGLLIKTTVNGVTAVENTEFDNLGNVLTQKVTLDVATSKFRLDKAFYDDNGRTIKTITDYGHLNLTNSVTYYFTGNQHTATDAEGNVTSNTYDAIGRLETVTTPTNDVTTYEYDITNALHPNQYGNMTIDARKKISYTWMDSLGRRFRRKPRAS